ncbi:MAG: GNAT family N-acetyltransferase [Microbacterium sp.]
MATPSIVLVRLTEVDVEEVAALLNEPRNARHMPLAGEPFTTTTAAAWVAHKDSQWDANGYGPWAILVDDEFAGWGGFQAEEDGADLGLVLRPAFWGRGQTIARLLLDHGFRAMGLPAVLVALPYTRSPDRVMARWGFEPDGDITLGGTAFRRYRLERARWLSAGRDASGPAESR